MGNTRRGVTKRSLETRLQGIAKQGLETLRDVLTDFVEEVVDEAEQELKRRLDWAKRRQGTSARRVKSSTRKG